MGACPCEMQYLFFPVGFSRREEGAVILIMAVTRQKVISEKALVTRRLVLKLFFLLLSERSREKHTTPFFKHMEGTCGWQRPVRDRVRRNIPQRKHRHIAPPAVQPSRDSSLSCNSIGSRCTPRWVGTQVRPRRRARRPGWRGQGW